MIEDVRRTFKLVDMLGLGFRKVTGTCSGDDSEGDLGGSGDGSGVSKDELQADGPTIIQAEIKVHGQGKSKEQIATNELQADGLTIKGKSNG